MGLKKILISAALAVAALLVAQPAQAAPAAAIRCSTLAVPYGRSGMRVFVRSDHRDPHRVHSYIGWYHDSNGRRGSITFIPYGPSITVGGHRWYKWASWQAGTRCRDYLVPDLVP